MQIVVSFFVAAIFVGRCCCEDDEFTFKTSSVTSNKTTKSLEVTIPVKRAFRFAFNPSLFSWKEPEKMSDLSSYTYTASMTEMPDLPAWMRYKHSTRHKTGFIYGVPPNVNERLILDVVATNRDTFETSLLKLVVIVVTSSHENQETIRGVRLKIDNLNLEDIFDSHRLRNLKHIFRQHLWPHSTDDLHLTFISSSLDAGFRRPVQPTFKDGVVLQLTSGQEFSETLIELNYETSPLRSKFETCPRDFKKTSVERHFREKGFAVDWCEFRLLEIFADKVMEVTAVPPVASEQNDSVSSRDGRESIKQDRFTLPDVLTASHSFPRREEVQRRNLSAEFLSSIVPACVLFVCLALVFGLLLCFRRQGEREEHWTGFVESFFLVFKDALTCCHCDCCQMKKKDQPANPLYLAAKQLQQSQSLRRNVQVDESTAKRRRASSVQRQTDTLRRLAQMRDVTPRLQVPAGVIPPSHSSPNGSIFQDDSFGTGFEMQGIRQSTPRDLLDTLPRPAPPPYIGHSTSMYNDDEGTYLV